MADDFMETEAAFKHFISVVREVRGQNTREFMTYLQDEIETAMMVLGIRTDPQTEPNRLRYVMDGAID